jgi:hypothetical protein
LKARRIALALHPVKAAPVDEPAMFCAVVVYVIDREEGLSGISAAIASIAAVSSVRGILQLLIASPLGCESALAVIRAPNRSHLGIACGIAFSPSSLVRLVSLGIVALPRQVSRSDPLQVPQAVFLGDSPSICGVPLVVGPATRTPAVIAFRDVPSLGLAVPELRARLFEVTAGASFHGEPPRSDATHHQGFDSS